MYIEQKKIDTWLCKIAGQNFAIASNRLKMLIEKPKSISIIGAPDLYDRMLFLQDKFYPMVNMNLLLDQDANLQVAALILYKDLNTDTVSYGAIEFDEIPEKILVSDDMMIDLKHLSENISKNALIGFEYMNQKVGVLNIDRIFNL